MKKQLLLFMSVVLSFGFGGFSDTEAPSITFGQSYNLQQREIDKPKPIAKFNVADHVLKRYDGMNELILNGQMKDALRVAEEFVKESSYSEINVNFSTEVDIPSQTQYLMSLLYYAEVLRAYGDLKKAAEISEKAYTVAGALREQSPADFLLAAPIIIKSLWDMWEERPEFRKLATDYARRNYNVSENIFKYQAIQGKLAVAYGLNNSLGLRTDFRMDVLRYFDIAADIFRINPGLASFEYASLPYYRAQAYMNRGRMEDVIVLLEKAKKELDVVIKINHPDNLIFADIDYMAGIAYIGLFKHTEALDSLSRALEHYKRVLGNENLKVAQVLRELSIAKKYKKDFNGAIADALSAVDIIKTLRGNEAVELLDHYISLSGIYIDAEKEKESLEALELAKYLNAKHYSKYNDVAKLLESNIKYVKNAMGYMWKN
ncbi:hypothetical protein ACHJH3_06380 [Campylobacter sp. MOP7]|uniref:hypothetical protein n=1 Tax=Campylobacter canis TaxID=3378588 RepID=UPI00387EAB8F